MILLFISEHTPHVKSFVVPSMQSSIVRPRLASFVSSLHAIAVDRHAASSHVTGQVAAGLH